MTKKNTSKKLNEENKIIQLKKTGNQPLSERHIFGKTIGSRVGVGGGAGDVKLPPAFLGLTVEKFFFIITYTSDKKITSKKIN